MSQKSRLPVYAGVAAVSAVGYYLYSAGGSPKVAEKKFERKSIGLEPIGRVEGYGVEILTCSLQMMSRPRLPG